MSKSDDEFLDLLAKSRAASFIVAEAFTLRRYRVRVIPSSVRPTFAQRRQYADEGDLEITMRMEVKRLSCDFHSVDSFPYANVIVDEAYKVETRKALRLYAYVCVNASLTGCLIIPTATHDAWFKEERFDKREGCKRLFYLCPKERTHYMQLPPRAHDLERVA